MDGKHPGGAFPHTFDGYQGICGICFLVVNWYLPGQGNFQALADPAATPVINQGTKSTANQVHIRFVLLRMLGISNDPSAGSPTETLLRLLLPLNDQV